jgi:hypothetical protein
MNIHPAGREHQTVGVDFALASAKLAADGRNVLAIDGYIAMGGRGAGTVDDERVANNQIVHG